MVEYLLKVPLWERGIPGFKAWPKANGQWSWKYLDADGYSLIVCALNYDSEQEALAACQEYWTHNRIKLEAAASAASMRAKQRRVAPQFFP